MRVNPGETSEAMRLPSSDAYPPWAFDREDETDDSLFYAEPRLVVHVDDRAVEAISSYLGRALPEKGVVLDLMSSWRSHLPEDGGTRTVVGLGLNAVEMAENPQLDGAVVHDLNADPRLPFDRAAFDAAVVTVSIQYMVRPVEVFAEVNRVLRPGGAFHVIYSNRMFPTKAVAIWRALDDGSRAGLIGSYFRSSGGWESPRAVDIGLPSDPPADPVYAVRARKSDER